MSASMQPSKSYLSSPFPKQVLSKNLLGDQLMTYGASIILHGGLIIGFFAISFWQGETLLNSTQNIEQVFYVEIVAPAEEIIPEVTQTIDPVEEPRVEETRIIEPEEIVIVISTPPVVEVEPEVSIEAVETPIIEQPKKETPKKPKEVTVPKLEPAVKKVLVSESVKNYEIVTEATTVPKKITPEPALKIGLIKPTFPAYLKNPPPAYPKSARRRKQEGTALLLVHVSENGRAAKVRLKKSSGYKILDQAAIQAVRKWSFVPASNNNAAIAADVIVPVRFALNQAN